MIGDACVFALTQISNDFACEYGELVTRRAGPDIACQSADMQAQCMSMYEQLKIIGLAEFEFEDDLTQVPHGVWAKIQFGGLLGLSHIAMGEEQSTVDNIASTIKNVMQENAQLDDSSQDQVIASMKAYRSRRGKRK